MPAIHPQNQIPPAAQARTELEVSGMNCNNCARHVTEALQSVAGVAGAMVELERHRATVRWQPGAKADADSLLCAVKQAGYEAKLVVPTTASARSELRVSGMTCGNCARHVTEALQGVSGVTAATVDLAAGRATVQWAAGADANPELLVQAVKAAGFGAQAVEKPPAGSPDRSAQRESGWHLNLWIGVIGTVPLMLGEWLLGFSAMPWFHWFSFLLAAVVQVFAGAPFYRGAWNQLKVGSSSMDTLVALGSTTAFGYSTWAWLSGAAGHLYFMEAAAIITLISVGHWIEARVSARASSALKALLNLAPALARRRDADGRENEVPVAELHRDDTVVLKPGDRVPTDGEVMEGGSAVDEAMLIGESSPVDKGPRDPLYAGTVNLNGRLLMRVTATGEETALSHIIAAVQRAQSSRANIQRLADRVSNVFVPVVVLVALAAALGWGLAPDTMQQLHDGMAVYLWPAHLPDSALALAFISAAAVLIIACPCAMGLATPAAIMAGSNAAARRGILIRDGVALEKAGKVTAVVFDKTGTLTAGKPAVAKVEIFFGMTTPSRERAMAMAAALARHSNHPISQAVARLGTQLESATTVEQSVPEAERTSKRDARGTTAGVTPAPLPSEEMAFDDWQEVRGAGVQGKCRIENRRLQTVRLGSLRWLAECGVDQAPAKAFVAEWAEQGATVLGLAADRSLLGVLAVKDTLKTGAGAVVRQLQRQGLKIFLVTGDNRLTAASLARQAGIAAENVFAEVRPEQKADFVKKLQTQGERVAFVGDGINDAPALVQADLGIAVSRASDVAREAADIILLKSEIEAVPESLELARATLRTIRQNLFWAFFYNAAGVPLAALGFMSPVLCALAMGVSDLIVIGNAVRLLRWKGGEAGRNLELSRRISLS